MWGFVRLWKNKSKWWCWGQWRSAEQVLRDLVQIAMMWTSRVSRSQAKGSSGFRLETVFLATPTAGFCTRNKLTLLSKACLWYKSVRSTLYSRRRSVILLFLFWSIFGVKSEAVTRTVTLERWCFLDQLSPKWWLHTISFTWFLLDFWTSLRKWPNYVVSDVRNASLMQETVSQSGQPFLVVSLREDLLAQVSAWQSRTVWLTSQVRLWLFPSFAQNRTLLPSNSGARRPCRLAGITKSMQSWTNKSSLPIRRNAADAPNVKDSCTGKSTCNQVHKRCPEHDPL